MDDTDHALFPRFSGELVATALGDTPVVMVTGPRQASAISMANERISSVSSERLSILCF